MDKVAIRREQKCMVGVSANGPVWKQFLAGYSCIVWLIHASDYDWCSDGILQAGMNEVLGWECSSTGIPLH